MLNLIINILKTSLRLAKKKIFIVFILIFLSMFLEFLGISLIMPAITLFINPDKYTEYSNHFLLSKFDNIHINDLGTYFLISFLIIVLVRYVVTIIVELLIVKYTRKIETDLLFKSLKFKLNVPWKELLLFENKKINKFILSDLGVYVGVGILNTLNLIKGLSIIIILLSFMIITTGSIVIVLAGLFLLFLIILNNFSKNFLVKISKKYSDILEYRYEFVGQLVTGIREMRIFQLVNHYSEKLLQNEFAFTKTEILRKFASILPKILVEIFVLFTIVILVIINQNNFQNLLPFLGLVAYILYRAQPTISNIAQLLITLQLHTEQITQIQKVLDDFLSQNLSDNSLTKTNGKIIFNNINQIELKNISFSYKNNEKIFENLNYKFDKGNIYGLSGKNGSGKSTFADIITGLSQPDNGIILVNEKNIDTLEVDWQRNTAYLSQSFFLFNETIKKNIILDFNNEKKFNKEMYEFAIKTTGLDILFESLKNGENTEILDFGKNFSGGQKQKIALARVLYKNLKFIIFDEATSALDKNSIEELFKIQEKIKKEKIIINIAHSKEILEKSDILLELKDKKIQVV